MNVYVFQLRRGDELAALQFLHLRQSVKNLDGAILVQDSDIANLEPSVLSQHFFRFFRVFEIALHDGVALDVDATSGGTRVC